MSRDVGQRIIEAAFDSFGLEEGKAILDEASRRMKDWPTGPSPTMLDFSRLVEVVAIEREAARIVARRQLPDPS